VFAQKNVMSVRNVMSMGESHEHGRTIFAYGGVNGVNIGFFVYFGFGFSFGLFFSFSVRQFSPYPDVSFLGLPPSIYAIFRELSSCLSTLS
jgi:hypothetical protein